MAAWWPELRPEGEGPWPLPRISLSISRPHPFKGSTPSCSVTPRPKPLYTGLWGHSRSKCSTSRLTHWKTGPKLLLQSTQRQNLGEVRTRWGLGGFPGRGRVAQAAPRPCPRCSAVACSGRPCGGQLVLSTLGNLQLPLWCQAPKRCGAGFGAWRMHSWVCSRARPLPLIRWYGQQASSSICVQSGSSSFGWLLLATISLMTSQGTPGPAPGAGAQAEWAASSARCPDTRRGGCAVLQLTPDLPWCYGLLWPVYVGGVTASLTPPALSPFMPPRPPPQVGDPSLGGGLSF